MGDLSAHFSRHEFRCHGFGQPGHPDHDTIVDPVLVSSLEELRRRVGRPLVIVSGHRCRWWNSKVGGASSSQHLVGKAADLKSGVVPYDVAVRQGWWGIGRAGNSAVHVDVRSGPRPARWRY